MKFHGPLTTLEVIKQHHEADAIGCGECFEDHCGTAHPEVIEKRILGNPEGCQTCWLIREVERLRASDRHQYTQNMKED